MKVANLLKKIVLAGVLTVFCFGNFAFADTTLPLDQKAVNIYQGGQIPGPATADYGDGISTIQEIILENGLTYTKIIIGVVAILYITILGVRLVTNGYDDDTQTKAKRAMTYSVVALVMISAGQEFAQIFDQESGTILQDPGEILQRIRLFDQSVEIIITFIKYVIGAFATIMAVRSGFKLVISGAEEEETTKHKKSLAYSAGGLLLIYVGHIFITRVFYRIDKTVYTGISGVQLGVDPYEGVRQIVGITNLVISFVGPLAVLMLVVGSLMYITALGEDDRMERAKRLLITTVIGVIIIYGAFALVSTFLAGRLPIEELT